jgi:hypothetical protein
MAEDVQWTFYGYCTQAGTRDAQDWFDKLSDEEKDEARDTLGYLRRIPIRLWCEPEFKPLGSGLSEIRFKVNTLKRIYRIYGFFWPSGQRYSYTFLLGANKKIQNPRKDIAEARRRQSRVERGEVSIHEFEFEGDNP